MSDNCKPLFRQNQIVVILAGRYAGCKGYVSYATEKKVCVALIKEQPKSITKEMTEEQIQKRTALKVAIKEYSPRHLIPTRFAVKETEFIQVKKDVFAKDQTELKNKTIKEIEDKLTAAYRKGNESYLFQKLSF